MKCKRPCSEGEMGGWPDVTHDSLELTHWIRCGRKNAYPLYIATAVAKNLTEESGFLVVAYKCYDCGSWHVGRADESQIKSRNMHKQSVNCAGCGGLIPQERIVAVAEQGNITKYCDRDCRDRARRLRPGKIRRLHAEGDEQ